MLRAAILGLLSAIAVLSALACTALSNSDAGVPCAASESAVCVLPLLAKSVSLSQPWGASLESAGKTCGVTSDRAASLWSAHVQAEVIEGFVPRAVGTDGGIKP